MTAKISMTGAGLKNTERPEAQSTPADRIADHNSLLRKAADAIRAADYALARDLLKQSVSTDMEDPEAYNLLGISYELEGDKLKASKFSRVAYYMDQTFGASFDHLERVCKFWYKDSSGIRWGLDG